MRLVRPVEPRDLPSLLALAQHMGPGMTTLPADPEVLARKVDASVASFSGTIGRTEASYLLVLEDDQTPGIMGTAALYAHVGSPFGFFSYKRLRLIQRSQALAINCEVEMLALANDYTGTTEVGTLAVAPDLKGSGAGRLLARSRYLLAASFPDLFSPLLMAEMRGWQDDNGHSPFWDAVGARFFNMDFATADTFSARRGSDFISELLPKHPVYVGLLPEATRDVIGRPHRDSAPALAMLRAEGFRYEGFVDVFDAGPQVHCDRASIATVKQSRTAPVAPSIAGQLDDAREYLVCNNDLARFRVVTARGHAAEDCFAVEEPVTRALGVEQGELVRYSPVELA